MVAPVLIFGIGNESRGDDALGPLLLRKLDAELTNHERSDHFELLEEFQLQIEHAMDMQGRQLVLFIDAGINTPHPFEFYRAQTSDTAVLYSHALAPEALLKVYTQLYQVVPPDMFVFCIRGERFELGEELTPQAVERLALALEFGKKLLQAPEITAWDSQCVQKTVAGQCAEV
jgi:hydrogenase maturation protease